MPAWIEQIGESEIVGAAVMSEAVFDDARTVLLESRHPDGETMAVGVLIDRNLGGLAKDVLLAESIEQVAGAIGRHSAGDEAELRAGAHRARRRRRADPGGDRADGHDLGSARRPMTSGPGGRWRSCAPTRRPGAVEPPEPTELSVEERDRLRDEFLSSPEGREFAPDGDEAWVASLAIDFCAGYTGGDPLRWSPVVVELFMSDWVPRKVLATPELLDRLPVALDAWVRFAARRRGIPEWAATRPERRSANGRRRWSRPHSTRLSAGPPSSSCWRRRRPALTSRTSRRWAPSSRAGMRAASWTSPTLRCRRRSSPTRSFS